MPWWTWPDSLSSASRVALFGALGAVAVAASSVHEEGVLPPGFPVIPEAGVLPHGAFALGGQLGFHSTDAGNPEDHYPWGTRLDMGMFGRGELGIEVGEAVGFFAKAMMRMEDGWWPAVAVGGRGLFHSGEAHFFSVPESLAEGRSNEVFVMLAKRMPGHSRLHGGFSVMGRSGALPSWGVEQELGAGAALLYDGYWREQSHHHDLGLRWRFGESFQFALGATEIWRWFYQDGAFGFFGGGNPAAHDGYDAPGLFANLVLVGRKPLPQESGSESRITRLEAAEKVGTRSREDLLARIDRLELQMAGMRGAAPDSVAILERKADSLLGQLVTGMQSDAWDPAQGRALGEQILGLGAPAHRWLVRTAASPSIDVQWRSNALRILGFSHDTAYLAALEPLLEDRESIVRKEALYAIGRIPGKRAADVVGRVAKEEDAELRSIASAIKGEAAKAPKAVAPVTPVAPTAPEAHESHEPHEPTSPSESGKPIPAGSL